MLEEGACAGTALAVASVLAVVAAFVLGGCFGSGAFVFFAAVGATEDATTFVDGALSGCPHTSTFCFFGGGPDVTDEDTAVAGTAEADFLIGIGAGRGGGTIVP